MRNVHVILIFVTVLIASECYGFRILGLFPLPIKSHNIFYGKLMSELARRGHEVHVVSHYPPEPPIPNYHHININGSLPPSVGTLSVQTRIHRGILGKFRYVFRTCGSQICRHVFEHKSIINLKNSTLQFDVVIAEVYGTDCLLAFAHHFRAPIIGISGTDLLPWANARMGNSDNPSHTPHYFVATNHKMVLYEKFAVIAATFFFKIGYFYLSTAPSEMRVREFFGNNVPSLDTLVYNTSLLLVNSHLSVNVPRPMVPGIVEVGGLHIESPKPLSKELNKIFKSSNEGVIYFSMGTLVNMKTFPTETLNEILSALSKMPQNIIFSATLENVTIPKNVFMIPWVPQVDILCHPKLKVFITHGGLMSIQEAAFCATPILGIPLFPDLERNVNIYVNRGGGLLVYLEDITNEVITKALNDLIANNTYREHAKKISNIFKERPISPLDTAIYWTEYVIKFGGGDHLRSRTAELIWFEYYLVDCLLLLILLQAIWIIVIINGYKYFLQVLDQALGFLSKMNVVKGNETDTESDEELEKSKEQ